MLYRTFLSLVRRGCLFVILGLLCTATVAADAEKPSPAQKPRDPAMTPVSDDPALPRVLLIGDSISIGYTVPVRDLLKGKANVHRPLANCGPTKLGVQKLDAWLGDGKWDVIHFNFGLHDLKQIDGRPQVPLDEYEKNLRQLVARLKKTGAKLIWCSTTPVPPGKLQPPRTFDDVLAYNAAAKKIMDAEGVAIDDLFAFAQPRVKEIQRPADVHFTAAGSKQLAQQVVDSIEKAMKEKH